MAQVRQRIFALFLAVLFLVTSLSVSGAVIWQIIQDNHKQPPAPSNSTNSTNSKEATNMLTGTKLTDFTPLTSKVDSLQKIDLTVGTGDEVKPGDTVTANYTGALTSDGTIFDASADHGGPQTFPLSGVIKGWTDGVPGMRIGGKRRLLIPAAEAYGSQSQSGIPANSDLVFDIEIVAISK